MWKVTVKGLLAHKLRLALTGLAIVLGVTFISGTLVLTDTLHNTFDTLFGQIYQNVDFVVRGEAVFTSNGPGGGAQRNPIPESVLAPVSHVPGVADAVGTVSGYAQFVAPDGKAVSNGGAPTLGFSFDPNQQLSSLRLAQGSAPTTPTQVAMDEGTAQKYHFAVGDRVRVAQPRPDRRPSPSRASSGSARPTTWPAPPWPPSTCPPPSTSSTRWAGTTRSTSWPSRGRTRRASSTPSPGCSRRGSKWSPARPWPTSSPTTSTRRCPSSRPPCWCSPSSRCSSGPSPSSTPSRSSSASGPASSPCCGSSGPAGARCSARCCSKPASSGWWPRSSASASGCWPPSAWRRCSRDSASRLPTGPLVFQSRTVVACLIVGIGVTVLSAISPARRAVRIPPVAAIADHRGDTRESSRRRLTVGGIVAVAGVVLLAVGLTEPAIQLVGLGAVAIFIGIGMLAPVVARPMASALGRPLAGLLGISGRLGRENSMRSPRRTAQTSSALMVGLALVSTMAVFGASLSSLGQEQRRQRHQRRLHRHPLEQRPERLLQLGGPERRRGSPGSTRCRPSTATSSSSRSRCRA